MARLLILDITQDILVGSGIRELSGGKADLVVCAVVHKVEALEPN